MQTWWTRWARAMRRHCGMFLPEYHAGGGDLADAAQKASVFAAQCCGHYGAFGHAMPHPDRCAGEQAHSVYNITYFI